MNAALQTLALECRDTSAALAALSRSWGRMPPHASEVDRARRVANELAVALAKLRAATAPPEGPAHGEF